MDKRIILIIFLALNFVSVLSLAQNEKEPLTEDIKTFKAKLQKYYEKRDIINEIPMPQKSIDTSIYNMPTGSIRSLMIDEELGLAYEFLTKKIYDKKSRLIYNISTEKIFDPETNGYFNFKINPKQ